VFGIVPSFVQRSMQGRFNGTPIIMMGCDGLRSQTTAQAFLDKGASDFVSWSQPVSSVHTDEATERLLERYLKEHESLADAVKETAAEVGPDPYFGGELRLLSSAKKAANSGCSRHPIGCGSWFLSVRLEPTRRRRGTREHLRTPIKR
jgi:hypothetical protein